MSTDHSLLLKQGCWDCGKSVEEDDYLATSEVWAEAWRGSAPEDLYGATFGRHGVFSCEGCVDPTNHDFSKPSACSVDKGRWLLCRPCLAKRLGRPLREGDVTIVWRGPEFPGAVSHPQRAEAEWRAFWERVGPVHSHECGPRCEFFTGVHPVGFKHKHKGAKASPFAHLKTARPCVSPSKER